MYVMRIYVVITLMKLLFLFLSLCLLITISNQLNDFYFKCNTITIIE